MSSKRNATKSVCRLLTVVACAVAPVLAVGCADQPTMLVITGVIPITGTEGACTVDPTTTLFLSSGTLDVAVADSYSLGTRVENVAPGSGEVGPTAPGGGGTQEGGGFENLDVEGNAIFVTKAAIDYDVAEDLSGVDLSGFDVPIAGPLVAPNGGTAAFSVPVFTSFQVAQMRDAFQALGEGEVRTRLIIAKVKMAGETSSDTDVESNTVGFPITVCHGCLAIAQCTESEAEALETGCVRPGQDQQYCLTVVPDAD